MKYEKSNNINNDMNSNTKVKIMRIIIIITMKPIMIIKIITITNTNKNYFTKLGFLKLSKSLPGLKFDFSLTLSNHMCGIDA